MDTYSQIFSAAMNLAPHEIIKVTLRDYDP
jgi:hypothetical protein